MPKLEYNFNEQQLDLILDSVEETTSIFNPINKHYVKMSVRTEDGDYIRSYYSNLDIEGNKVTYIPSGEPESEIASVEILSGADGYFFNPNMMSGIDTTNLQEDDILRTSGNHWTENNADFEIIQVMNGAIMVAPGLANLSYRDIPTFQVFRDMTIEASTSDWYPNSTPQLRIYKDNNDNLYFKPNESLEMYNDIPQGNYKLQFDFLDNPFEYRGIMYNDHYFFITEISPSRKEVRVIIRDESGNRVSANNDNFSFFITTEGEYNFDHVLTLSQNINIPIVNYAIDEITDAANASIIIKLGNPIPSGISLLSEVGIEKELITTQTEDIWYRTDLRGELLIGDGLERSGFIEVDSNDQVADTFQSYSDITSSLVDSGIENWILSGSDVNLNIDYNEFANHSFFGSAEQKLKNFKAKVSEIEDYHTKISSSLSGAGVAITGDSTNKKDIRKDLFGKIQDVVDTFTPYERFLYYDNQSETTASAPGLGKNYAHDVPVNTNELNATLTKYDGFDIVYKHTGSNATSYIDLFTNQYKVEEKPFFNYSDSVYLSYLWKADDSLDGHITWENRNTSYGSSKRIPHDAFSNNKLLSEVGRITGSQYIRVIYEASQSYWAPSLTGSNDNGQIINGDVGEIDNWSDSEQWDILSGSNVTGSYPIRLVGDFYPSLGTTVTSSGVPFTGSVMPAGELFRIYWPDNGGSSEITSSYITDIKLTTKDPSDALPFSFVYSTGSSAWTDWYDERLTLAQSFDDDNIHSLVNNLPKLIRDDSESTDLKLFINMFAEQFDLIRSYIDNYLSFYKRQYNKLESVPTNLMPILAENLGWELIQPFTGSIAEYLGTSEHDISTNDRTVEEITHNTWRKILNNLIYIYKTKGTLEGIRSLLNTFGYPPDTINVREMGGSTTEQGSTTINDDITTLLSGLGGETDNVSYVTSTEEFHSYNFNGDTNRILNFDWGTNQATDINTLEFVFNAQPSSNTQVLIESVGSTLWDLRLVPSASSTTVGKMEFRLNNSHTGSSAIASNAISMSSAYLPFNVNAKLWNVMLQRMTGSISGSGIQEYRLVTGLQDNDKITQFNAVSMSVSGGASPDSNYYANQNWIGTGSLDSEVSGNLRIGRTYTGSLAEFRTWTTALSASKFKQHILNKASVVGNNITSSLNELVYRYRLNENWKSGQSNPKIYDANSENITDYSLTVESDVLTGSALYDRNEVDIVKFSLRMGGSDQPNSNKIIINPSEPVISNLNPDTDSRRRIYDKKVEQKRYNTRKVQIVRSPQKVLNDFIIDTIADYSIDDKFGDPADLYETQYTSLDKFRNDLFDHFNVSVDINKWIRAQANALNQSFTDAVKKVLPARSAVENVSVQFEPTLLERNKAKMPTAKVQHGSDIGYLETDDDVSSYITLDNSTNEAAQEGEYDVTDNITETGTNEASRDAEYDVTDNITKEATYAVSRAGEYSITDNIIETGTREAFYEGIESYIASQSHDSFVNLADSWGTSSDDTHFVNMAWSGSGDPDNDTWRNVNHYEERFVFQTVGDVEIISSSRTNSIANSMPDFTEQRFFLSREIRDTDKGYTYYSYIKNGSDTKGIQDGRPVGRTAYFSTGSDGDIVYPSNHWINTSEEGMRTNFIDGTQNVGGQYMELSEWEDLSTSSFYSVKVTGEDQLVVRRGKATKTSIGISRK